MTVKELREMLAGVPDDVEVEFCTDIDDIYDRTSPVGTAFRLTNLDVPGDDRVILVEK